MNYDLMFDLTCNVVESHKEGVDNPRVFKIGKKEVKLNRNQQEAVLQKAIQAFMMGTGQVTDLPSKKAIQAFSGSSDLPALTKDVFNVTNQTPNFDLLWQESFKGIQLKKGQLSWEIATVDSGVAFKLIPEGGKVEYADVAGEKVTASIEKYGAGLGVTWEIIEGRKLYQFVQVMEDARNKLFKLWADIHYGLLGTAGTSNQVPWQLTTSDPTLDRDIATLNKGAEDCGDLNKDKGFGDTANSRYILYVSPKLRSRMTQALRVTSADMARSGGKGQIVDAMIEPKFTYNSAVPANKGLLVLPGNKIQNSIYMREMGLSRKEIESLNELLTYWTAFGAVVADTDQVFELDFA